MKKSNRLELFLILLISSILIFGLITESILIANQIKNYDDIIELEFTNPSGPDMVVLFTISKSLDATIVRSTSIFFSFTLVLLGALMLFRAIDAQYELSLKTGSGFAMDLKSSSPGLILATGGIVLLIVVNQEISGKAYLKLPAGSTTSIEEVGKQ